MTDKERLEEIHDAVIKINDRLFIQKNSLATQIEMNSNARMGITKKLWGLFILILALLGRFIYDFFRVKNG